MSDFFEITGFVNSGPRKRPNVLRWEGKILLKGIYLIFCHVDLPGHKMPYSIVHSMSKPELQQVRDIHHHMIMIIEQMQITAKRVIELNADLVRRHLRGDSGRVIIGPQSTSH